MAQDMPPKGGYEPVQYKVRRAPSTWPQSGESGTCERGEYSLAPIDRGLFYRGKAPANW